MDGPASIPRLVSFVSDLGSGGDSTGSSRVLAGGSLGSLLSSVVANSIGYGMLPEQMRIHWTLGMGPYYGPEFAPTLLVLTLFTVLIAGTAVIGYAVDTELRGVAEFGAIRPYYVVATLGTLSVLLVSQIALIVANL